jgi:hypothetical protein
MAACRECFEYGNPGYLPVLIEYSAAELALPPHRRPPKQVIWTPCWRCLGGVASCCEDAGAERQS